MSGGGSAGDLKVPEYMEQIHKRYFWPYGNMSFPGATQTVPYNVLKMIERVQLGNPYAGHFPYPARTPLPDPTSMQLGWNSLTPKVESLGDLIGQLNHIDDWKEIVEKSIEQVDKEGVLKDVNISDAVHKGIVASDRADEAVAMASAVVSSITEEDFDELLATSKGVTSSINPLANWQSIMNASFNSVSERIKETIDVDKLAEETLGHSTAQVKEAIENALANVDNSVVASTVQAFRVTLEPARIEAYRRLSSYMSELGITHSSSFMLGAFLIEENLHREVGRFQGELRYQLYQQAIAEHGQTYRQQLSSIIQAEIQLKTMESGLIQTGVEVMSRLILGKVEFTQAISSLIGQIKSQGTLTSVQAYLGAFVNTLSSMIRAKFMDKASRDEMAKYNIAVMADSLYKNITANEQYIGIRGEIGRLFFVSRSEYEERTLAIRKAFLDSEMEVVQHAANVLAAPSGAVGYVPKTPGWVGSTLGGALQGFAVGAQTGNPYLMGAGALLGAGAGLGQSL